MGRFVMSTVRLLPSHTKRLAVVTSSTCGCAGTEGSARVAGVGCGGSGAPRRFCTKSAKLVMINGADLLWLRAARTPGRAARTPRTPGSGLDKKLLVSYYTLARGWACFFGTNWPYRSKKMPRTRAQRRAAQGPLGLNDDALRRVLTFLSVSDSRSAGGASKALRAVATSNELTRLRGAESYVLRGSNHGVVHALATALGTQPWRRVQVDFPSGGLLGARRINDAMMPPSRLRFTYHREIDPEVWESKLRAYPHLRTDAVFPFSWVDQDSIDDLCTGSECIVRTGTFAEFQLPFQLRLSSFRLGHGPCSACGFQDWVFEAFDGERWHVLYECCESPWWHFEPHVQVPTMRFHIDAAGVASSRFRLRILPKDASHGPESPTPRCMHIRDFELFGTVLPPWSV